MHFPQIGAHGGAARWALLTALFVISLPAVTVRFYASDEIEYFAYLRSMWFDGDLSFDNEYRYFYDRGIARGWRFKETFLDGETATGKRINFAPVGSAILWSPFYILTDATVRTARAIGVPVTADGYSTPYIASVVYASALYGFLAVALSAYAAARVIGDGAAAAAAAMAVWLGTPIVFYMYLAPGFSHACSAFAVAAFVVIWLHVRQDWSLKGAVALGAAAALMGMVREQDMFIALGPALDFVLTARRRLQDGTWGCDGRRYAGRRGHSGRRSLLHAAGVDVCFAVWTARSVIDGARQDDVDIAAYVARTVFTVERVVVLDAACVARADGTGMAGGTTESPGCRGDCSGRPSSDCDDLSRDGHDADLSSAAHSIRGRAPARSASVASWD